MKTPIWIGTEPHEPMRFTRADDGDYYTKRVLAYWGVCIQHGLLIPQLMGECLHCPECPKGVYHYGHLANVGFHSMHPAMIEEAVRRTMALDPALFDGKHDFDLVLPGEKIVRHKDEPE